MLHIYKYVHTHTHIHKTVVTQSCPTLWDPMDCRPPGSSVHGILQARILEWLAISFSRGSSWPRNQTQISCIAGRFFTNWAMREAPWKSANTFLRGYIFICIIYIYTDTHTFMYTHIRTHLVEKQWKISLHTLCITLTNYKFALVLPSCKL